MFSQGHAPQLHRDLSQDAEQQMPHSMIQSDHFTLFGQAFPARKAAPGLALVSTPIGNLGDMTLRALEILAGSDAILAEDTRVTRPLLTHFGVSTPLIAYHDHNEAQALPGLIARLKDGAALALVSDAGTPLLSDPGFRLARAARAEGLNVYAAPGASALLAGLVASGLPAERFFFEGFLPAKSGARRARLAALAAIPAALVFYESPRRLGETLADCAQVLGARDGAVARELTKKFEEVRAGRLAELAAFYADNEPRGEIVLIVGPPEQGAAEADEASLETRLRAAMADHSLKDAAAIVAGETGQNRKKLYALALRLQNQTRADDAR
jgi:16S rRNA (cytidine1402-2'-O)-methyltransferase